MISTLIKVATHSTLALIACSRQPHSGDAAPGNSAPSTTREGNTRTTSAPADTNGCEKSYRGNIGNNIPIRMKLCRDGEKLKGTYQYVKVGQDLRLEGEMGRNGSFQMNEYHGNKVSTGTFLGGFVGNTLIEGMWIEGGANGQKQLPFTLWLEKPIAGVADFTGTWNYENDGYVFSLDLGLTGDSVIGYHCAVTKNATRVDCNDLRSNPDISDTTFPSIRGTIRGNVATVTFESGYGMDSTGKPVSGQATMTLHGDLLDWKITTDGDGDYYLAREATLKREK
jgi:hypothetical protein